MIDKIKKLAKEKNAIILSHNYQSEDVQKVATFVGDSYELSKIAAKNDAKIIVFCGVHFMAESAYMLSPDKKIILPAIDAGCPMADMIDDKELECMKKDHPNAKVVLYINSSAKAKAIADSCCTSSNAIKVVNNIDADEIIFAPDKNLANYVSKKCNKKIIPANGYCPRHNALTIDDVKKARAMHPNAILIVHPECPEDIILNADEVFSTGEMVTFAKKTSAKEIIVGTENSMIFRLKAENSNIKYYPLKENFICENMQKTTLDLIYTTLLNETNLITVEDKVAKKAVSCLNEMLRLAALND